MINLFKSKNKMKPKLYKVKWNEQGIKSAFGEDVFEFGQKINKAYLSNGIKVRYAVYNKIENGEMTLIYSNLIKECPVFLRTKIYPDLLNENLDADGYKKVETPQKVLDIINETGYNKHYTK